MKYASFWQRLAALLIDGVLLGAASALLESFFSRASSDGMGQIIAAVGVIAYMVYFIGSKGQTLGKMVMHIKVVDKNGRVIGYGNAVLRELVGKIVSGLVLNLGYFWMIWDNKKQTWHDKIAKTFVIKV